VERASKDNIAKWIRRNLQRRKRVPCKALARDGMLLCDWREKEKQWAVCAEAWQIKNGRASRPGGDEIIRQNPDNSQNRNSGGPGTSKTRFNSLSPRRVVDVAL